jgi:hypothetical protein
MTGQYAVCGGGCVISGHTVACIGGSSVSRRNDGIASVFAIHRTHVVFALADEVCLVLKEEK